MTARSVSALLVCLAPLACSSGVTNDPGRDALLRVEAGSFVRGALPDDGPGPAVMGAFMAQPTVRAGQQRKSFNGVLGETASAAAIALAGDAGFWVVPAGYPPAESPETPSFDAPLSFSSGLTPGAHELYVWAVDAASRYGSRAIVPFTALGAALPDGQLVISLSWDNASDLDLHVVTPNGVEIYDGNVNSWRPGEAGDYHSGGILDFDSNAECQNDGRRLENVIWQQTPPSGHYLVRVDTSSLCGEALARWSVVARLPDGRVLQVRGTSTPTATRGEHGLGAGTLALELDVR